MNVWNRAPLVRLILPFLVGIITAIYFPFQYQYCIHIIALLVVIESAIVFIPKLRISYRKSWGFGILVNMTLFISAYQLTIFKTDKFASTHFSKIADSTQYVYVRIKEPYIEKEKSLKIIVEVMAVEKDNKWQPTTGKAMVYFKKDTQALKLSYGDELIMKIQFKKILSIQNPGAFDYKNFLAFHNIFQQGYITSDDWMFTGSNSGNPLLRHSINLRNNLMNNPEAEPRGIVLPE